MIWATEARKATEATAAIKATKVTAAKKVTAATNAIKEQKQHHKALSTVAAST